MGVSQHGIFTEDLPALIIKHKFERKHGHNPLVEEGSVEMVVVLADSRHYLGTESLL